MSLDPNSPKANNKSTRMWDGSQLLLKWTKSARPAALQSNNAACRPRRIRTAIMGGHCEK